MTISAAGGMIVAKGRTNRQGGRTMARKGIAGFRRSARADGRNVFFFWDDPSRLPADYKSNIKAMQALHPDWSVQLADDGIIAGLLARDHPEISEVYGDIRVPACRSDIARLAMLAAYGGWYLDADMSCREPLDSFGTDRPIVFRRDDTAGMKARFRTMNGILYMPPGHPLPHRMLAAVAAHIQDRRHLHDVLAFAGPKLLSDMVQETGVDDCEILSVKTHLRGRDPMFREIRGASSFSWRIQQCFGILPVAEPDWEVFPPQLRPEFVPIIKTFVAQFGLQAWLPELALRRPGYMRVEGFAELVRACGLQAYEQPVIGGRQASTTGG
ncbi:hypothetical protein DFK10_08030 [Salibaculum griseiflavum]|uniref:Mannosyltransferase n=2 Tax=Salibaculum griseiflavum TaxID=1914409 RepID=A0A2V1P493_9RHOB|nr:hypothetical protein DFK10_08030 [Salibaculum griseiflavum]